METLFVGKNMLFLTEVESTNTYAMHMLRNVNVIEGTVVYTDNQTKGKGQRGAVWNSLIASNITASVILKPVFLDVGKSFFLSKITALAVHDLLTDILGNSHYDIKIKWPNDILVNSMKIAGILIENTYNHNHLHYSVIGIGLNVNQAEFDTINHTATSLKLLTGNMFSRDELLEKLCGFIEKWYLKLKSGKLSELNKHYMDNLLGLNQNLRFRNTDGSDFEAKIIHVGENGKLHLQMPDLTVKEFDIKELKFLI